MLRLWLLLGRERFASPLRAETSALFVHATSREKHELVEFCFKHDILCLRKKTKCHSEMCAVVYFKGFMFSCNNVTRVCSKFFKTIIKVLGKEGSTDGWGCEVGRIGGHLKCSCDGCQASRDSVCGSPGCTTRYTTKKQFWQLFRQQTNSSF